LQVGERLYFEQRCSKEYIIAAMIQDAFEFHMVEGPNYQDWTDLKRLYNWYKFERPIRRDPFDFDFDGPRYIDKDGNPTDDMFGEHLPNDFIRANKISEQYGAALAKASELQAKYELEDTNNAKRLVEIRGLLWT
jgi:hypothetical protein